jgi:hypothetical protein
MSDKGRRFPCEARGLRDERTGAAMWQVTDSPCINHSLYFLSNSLLPDDSSLIFASFRNGAANFYRTGFPEGEIIQLTDSPGINSFSAVIGPDANDLFFTRSDEIVALEIETLEERIVARFPGGKLGEVNISLDGIWVVSAIRVGNTFGVAIATSAGTGHAIIHHQDRTIIHPQFSRTDTSVIEFASDPAPRMYVVNRDGSHLRCLHEHGNDEFIVHETWLGDTGDLIFTVWPRALKRLDPSTGEITTIADFNAWHICPTNDGRYVVCDTNHPDEGIQLVDVATGRRQTICYPQSSNRGSQWAKDRYALAADFAAAAAQASASSELSWMELKTDTVYGPQWTHPHPAISDSERYATFTSDRSGHPQVYVVELPRMD